MERGREGERDREREGGGEGWREGGRGRGMERGEGGGEGWREGGREGGRGRGGEEGGRSRGEEEGVRNQPIPCCRLHSYPVAHSSIYSSQEHHIPQQQSNGKDKVQMNKIVNTGEHCFTTGIKTYDMFKYNVAFTKLRTNS